MLIVLHSTQSQFIHLSTARAVHQQAGYNRLAQCNSVNSFLQPRMHTSRVSFCATYLQCYWCFYPDLEESIHGIYLPSSVWWYVWRWRWSAIKSYARCVCDDALGELRHFSNPTHITRMKWNSRQNARHSNYAISESSSIKRMEAWRGWIKWLLNELNFAWIYIFYLVCHGVMNVNYSLVFVSQYTYLW